MVLDHRKSVVLGASRPLLALYQYGREYSNILILTSDSKRMSYSRPERGELELEDDYRAVGWRKFMGSSISVRCVDV